MAEVIWTVPALNDLDAIADYIALDDRRAARGLAYKVFQHVEQLMEHPESASRPPEMRRSRYRQIVEAPCHVFYRYDGTRGKSGQVE
jgi:toxin ParE1/3/4